MTQRRLTILVLSAVLVTGPARAQIPQSPKRVADLAERSAQMAIASGDYQAAIGHIQTVLKFVDTIDIPEIRDRYKTKVQQLEFTLAFCHVASGNYAGGIEAFNAFLAKYPHSNRRLPALNLRALSEHNLNQWEALTETLRQVLAFNTLPDSERMELIMLLGQAYRELENHEEAFKAFRVVMARAYDPSLRMTSISYTLDTILKLERADFLYKLVPSLQGGVSPAKYSLAFNLKAIEAADKLAYAGNTSSALVLLKLCQPLGEIRKGLELVKQSLESLQESLSKRSGGAMRYLHKIMAVESRLRMVHAEIDALETAVDYDEGLQFRVAQLLFQMDLYYESYWSFRAILEAFPDSDNIPDALYAASILAGEVGLTDRALEHGEALVTGYPTSSRAAEAALSMAYIYQESGQFGRMYEHLKASLARGNFRSSQEDQNHAHYLAGYSCLYQDQFDQALDNFNRIEGPRGSSRFHRDSDYWRAYIEMFTDNYPEAVNKFEAFLGDYPHGAYVEDATYRLALARFGMGDMEGTRAAVEAFIENYPESRLRGEAYNLMGDVYGSFGMLDEAIEAYNLVEVFTDDPNQVHSAAFNAGRIMEADARWEAIIKHFKRYLNRYGRAGRFTMAIYKIGEALVKLDRADEALKHYWAVIRRFSNDPQALGIDLMLRDYVADFQRVHIEKTTSEQAAVRKERRKQAALAREADGTLSDEQLEAARQAEMQEEALEAARVFDEAVAEGSRLILAQLKGELDETPDDGSQETKRLRLLFGLDFAENTSRSDQYFSARQVAAGTPLTLDWMAGILRDRGRLDLAEASYKRVISDFPETEVSSAAYMGLGELARARGDSEEALEYFRTVYELYPTGEHAGHAVMQISDILYEQGQYDKAAAQYEEIVMVREWRGPLWPEALYKVGRCHLAKGDAEKAFAYFQRVYVLYGGYTTWVAKAYLDSGACLEQLGRKVEAARTYQEMLAVDALIKTPEGREALQRVTKLPAVPVEEVADET